MELRFAYIYVNEMSTYIFITKKIKKEKKRNGTYCCELNTSCGELLCRSLCRVSSDASDLVLLGELGVVEDVVDDGAALVASGTEYGNELGHFGGLIGSKGVAFCKSCLAFCACFFWIVVSTW